MFFNHYRCNSIDPDVLRSRINSGSDLFLLDVRTRQENAVDAIPGSYLVPLTELAHRFSELPTDREIVVYCRVGNRSAYACSFLASRGYNVKNLEGGILQWNMSGFAELSKV